MRTWTAGDMQAFLADELARTSGPLLLSRDICVALIVALDALLAVPPQAVDDSWTVPDEQTRALVLAVVRGDA